MQLNTSQLDPAPILDDLANEIGRRELVALSQLAALQGHVLSYRELKRLLQGLDQQSLQGVPLSSRLAALWCSRFPQSKVVAAHWPLKPEDVPALWISRVRNTGFLNILVIIGIRENGGLTYLSHDGEAVELPTQQAHLGSLLVLKVKSQEFDNYFKLNASIKSESFIQKLKSILKYIYKDY